MPPPAKTTDTSFFAFPLIKNSVSIAKFILSAFIIIFVIVKFELMDKDKLIGVVKLLSNPFIV